MRLPPNYSMRADAGEVALVERALNYVETEAYNTVFPPLEGLVHVPVDTSVPVGAKTTSYKQYTRVGVAKLVSERGGDAPTAKLFVKEFFHQFYRLGASYEYTLDDLLGAQFAAQQGGPALNIDLEEAVAAKEAIARGLDVVAGIGSTTSSTIPGLSDGIGPDVGLVGLLNLANATTYTPAAGASGSAAWATKTPDEKIADLTGMYTAMVQATYKAFKPDTILLPITQYEGADGQRMGDGSDETVISFFKKIKKGITIDSWQYCQGAGTAGADRAVAFVKNKRYVRHVISELFRQMPPETENTVFSTLCLAKTAGVISPYPISVLYCDGL